MVLQIRFKKRNPFSIQKLDYGQRYLIEFFCFPKISKFDLYLFWQTLYIEYLHII